MAIIVRTITNYPLNGSSREFDITFDYLARRFVKVAIISADQRVELINGIDYRFVTKTRIRTTSAIGGAWERIELRRETSSTDRIVNFADGSILRAKDLNASQIQAIHIAEESRDLATLSISQNDLGELDAGGRRLTNLGEPISDSDAATKGYVDTGLSKTIRLDRAIQELTGNVSGRVLSFNDAGDPVAIIPSASSELALAALLKSIQGASEVTTSRGASVETELTTLATTTSQLTLRANGVDAELVLLTAIAERRIVYVEDYFPEGFVAGSTVDVKPYTQLAINEAASTGRVCIMPNYQIHLDILTGGLSIPTNSEIYFQTSSSIAIHPVLRGSFIIFNIVNASNIKVYNAVIYGDKYTHLGTDGEHGHGIGIRGTSDNVYLLNPKVYNCWGDGYYIGHGDVYTREASPSNIVLDNPVADRCRRQGMSITSVEGLVINNPMFPNTKSTDSNTTLVNGPHAGIDIEPNFFASKLTGIRIYNLNGHSNDGALLIISLFSVVKDAPVNGEYPLDILIDGIHDRGSQHCVQLMGSPSTLRFTGQVTVNRVISNYSKNSGISIRTWRNKGVPIVIDGVLITEWARESEGGLEPHLQAAISFERGDGHPDLGGVIIKGVKLVNSSPTMSPALVTLFNNSGAINDTIIEIESVDVVISSTYYIQRLGDCQIINKTPFRAAVLNMVASHVTTAGSTRDIHIKAPPVATILDLGDMSSYYAGRGLFYFYLMFTPGVSESFQIRASTTPMIVNGVEGVRFGGTNRSGLIKITYMAGCYYVESLGILTKLA